MLCNGKQNPAGTKHKDIGLFHFESGKHSPVCKRDRVAVEVENAIAVKAGDGAVSGKGPDAACFHCDDGISLNRRSALCVWNHIDRACERAAVFEYECKTSTLGS